MPLFDYIKSDKNETRVKKFLIKNCEAKTIFFKTIFFFALPHQITYKPEYVQ